MQLGQTALEGLPRKAEAAGEAAEQLVFTELPLRWRQGGLRAVAVRTPNQRRS